MAYSRPPWNGLRPLFFTADYDVLPPVVSLRRARELVPEATFFLLQLRLVFFPLANQPLPLPERRPFSQSSFISAASFPLPYATVADLSSRHDFFLPVVPTNVGFLSECCRIPVKRFFG